MPTRVRTKIIERESVDKLEQAIESFMRDIGLCQLEQYKINYVTMVCGGVIRYSVMVQYEVEVAG